jgi:uncharacterized cupredoxin-like copper-binding protein
MTKKVSLVVAACLVLAAAPVAFAVSGSSKASKSAKLITTINVIAGKPSEFRFKLSKSTAKRGIITFKIVNSGQIPHDFKFCSKKVSNLAANTCTGRSTQQISPGQSTTLRVTVLLAGTYEYLCTLPAHAANGMKGLFKVT